MKEQELIELARGLCHLYNIYQSQKTAKGKEKAFEILKAYSFSFAQACNSFYNEIKTTEDWLRFFAKKQRSENLKTEK